MLPGIVTTYSGDPPPIIGRAASEETKTVPRWRWWLHLLLLTLFPLTFGLLGFIGRNRTTAILPSSVSGLLWASLSEIEFFVLLFAIAWLFSRVNARQMMLKWRSGVMPLLLGFSFSIAMRVVILMVLLPLAAVWFAIHGGDPHEMEKLRPGTEHLLDATALVQSPIYFALCLTLISFVVAGLREELWRAGMFAGIKILFPRQFSNWRGKTVGIVVVSVLFGLAHTSQGWAGVCATTVLGLGLGGIMLMRVSIWEAVIAHGFFDAATFLALYLLTKYHVGPFHNA